MNDEIKVEEVIEEEIIEEEVVEEEEPILESITLGNKEYKLIKTGAEQAIQVSGILNWLGKYGERIAEVLSESNDDSALNEMSDAWQLIAMVGKLATPEALIELFEVAIGCSREEAVEHFSVNLLVDAVLALFSQEEYAKLVNRFF